MKSARVGGTALVESNSDDPAQLVENEVLLSLAALPPPPGDCQKWFGLRDLHGDQLALVDEVDLSLSNQKEAVLVGSGNEQVDCWIIDWNAFLLKLGLRSSYFVYFLHSAIMIL